MSFETHTGTFSFLLLLNKWDPQVALFPDSAEGQSLESLDPYLETPPDGFCHFLPQKMCIMYIHRISWIFRDDMLFQNQSNITWNRLPMIIRLISRFKVRGTEIWFFSSQSCSPTEASTGSTVSVFIVFFGKWVPATPDRGYDSYDGNLTVQVVEPRRFSSVQNYKEGISSRPDPNISKLLRHHVTPLKA